MRLLQLIFATAVLAFGLAAQAADDLDRADPVATAVAFLHAYKARDLTGMAALANAKNTEDFNDMVAQGEASPSYGRIYKGWRLEAAEGWSGTIGETRYRGGDALVAFAEIGEDNLVTVHLSLEDGQWSFAGFRRGKRGRFEALPLDPQ